MTADDFTAKPIYFLQEKLNPFILLSPFLNFRFHFNGDINGLGFAGNLACQKAARMFFTAIGALTCLASALALRMHE